MPINLKLQLARDHGYTAGFYIWVRLPDKAAIFARLAAHYAGKVLEEREQRDQEKAA